MRLTRIHVPERLAVGQQVTLPEAASLHIARVLRLAVGAPVLLFDGHGGEYQAVIVQLARGAVRAAVERHQAIEREARLQITLLQALARSEKMDWIIQKTTELGVHRIVPLALERSVVKLDERQADKRLAHWRAVAVSACEQCGRNRLPAITAPASLTAALDRATGLRLLLDPDATEPLQAHGDALGGSVSLLIGPEGGLTSAETAAAVTAGFQAVSFGARILRTETAAVAAVSVLQFLGDSAVAR